MSNNPPQSTLSGWLLAITLLALVVMAVAITLQRQSAAAQATAVSAQIAAETTRAAAETAARVSSEDTTSANNLRATAESAATRSARALGTAEAAAQTAIVQAESAEASRAEVQSRLVTLEAAATAHAEDLAEAGATIQAQLAAAQATLTALADQPLPEIPLSQPFAREDGALSLSYPPEWYAREVEPPGIQIANNPDILYTEVNDLSGIFSIFVRRHARADYASIDLTAHPQDSLTQLITANGGGVFLWSGTARQLTLAGRPVTRLYGTYTENGQQQQVMALVIVWDDELLVSVAGYAHPGELVIFEPTLLAVAASAAAN